MLEKIESMLVYGIQRLMTMLFVLAALLYATQVFLRVGFSGGLFWIDGLTSRLFALSALLGAALAANTGENIKIEALQFLAKKKAFRLLINLFSAVISVLLLYILFLYLREVSPGLVQNSSFFDFDVLVETGSIILYFLFFVFLLLFYILRILSILKEKS